MSTVTLEQFAAHLNMTPPALGSADAGELQLHLDAAELMVEHRCGPLSPGERTYSVYPAGRALVLPSTALATVETVRDSYGTEVTVDAQHVDLAAGVITVPFTTAAGPWEVDVTVIVEPPRDLVLAVLIIAAHLWETQRGSSARPGYMRNRRTPDEAPTVPMGFAVPNRAAELMSPYELPVFA